MNDTHAENGSGPASWVRWVVATAIGVLVAFAGFVVIFEIFGEPDHLLFPLLMTAVGVVFGAFQQHVLRHALVDVQNWALVTGLGFGVGIALALAIGEGAASAGRSPPGSCTEQQSGRSSGHSNGASSTRGCRRRAGGCRRASADGRSPPPSLTPPATSSTVSTSSSPPWSPPR